MSVAQGEMTEQIPFEVNDIMYMLSKQVTNLYAHVCAVDVRTESERATAHTSFSLLTEASLCRERDICELRKELEAQKERAQIAADALAHLSKEVMGFAQGVSDRLAANHTQIAALTAEVKKLREGG